MDEAIAFLKTIAPLEKHVEEKLRPHLFIKVFSPRAMLLEAGQECNNVYFIVKGAVRVFSDWNEKECNSWILMENNLVVSPDSFFDRTSSLDYIQAMKKTMVVGLSYKDLQQLYDEFHSFERIGHLLTRRYYSECHKRVRSLVETTNEERYHSLRKDNPALIQHITNEHIASYLGMSDATLERIRRNKF